LYVAGNGRFTYFFLLCKTRFKEDISYKDAFIIGVAQCFAVLPGLSRSGSTIATGLLLGNKKELVAKFSFLMVIIPILGESVLDLLKGGFSLKYQAFLLLP
jgi:undecaprenyl-diphosphatase